MNAAQLLQATTPSILALQQQLRNMRSPLSPTEAVSLAIDQWLAAQRDGSARGYQWKCLFLPEGSELRMHYAGESYFARVTGDDIIYQGQRVSPRQLTLAIAGDGRNAWRDLWIRLPDEKTWACAATMRRAITKTGVSAPASPVATMAAAAACMTQALKTALALVEHSNAEAVKNYERRMVGNRRVDDRLADYCQLD
jgi:hypothetical protein